MAHELAVAALLLEPAGEGPAKIVVTQAADRCLVAGLGQVAADVVSPFEDWARPYVSSLAPLQQPVMERYDAIGAGRFGATDVYGPRLEVAVLPAERSELRRPPVYTDQTKKSRRYVFFKAVQSRR
jgi:hypothetical protein